MALVSQPACAPSSAALSTALAEFQASLSDERKAHLLLLRGVPRAIDVLTFTAELDSANAMRKRRCVASRFCTVLECIQQYTAVMDTYSQVKADTTSLIWGSLKLCIKVASSAASYYDKLSEWFMKLGTLCPRLSEWQSLFPTSAALQRALDAFYATVIRFCTRAVQVLDRTGAFNFVMSLWRPFEIEFGDFERSMRQQRAEIDDEIRLAAARATMHDIETGSRFRDALSKTLSGWRSSDDDRNKMIDKAKSMSRKERLLGRLSSFDYKAGLKEFRKKRHGSTCSWLVTQREYRSWVENQNSSLAWLSGGVGSGKSVLVATVVDDILRNHVKGDTTVSFLFCKDNDAESVKAATILQSMIRQCLTADEISEDLCTAVSDVLADGRPEPKELAELFTRVSSLFRTHFVVIDGWDECAASERFDVMDVLGRVVGAGTTNLKLFIACCENISNEVPSSFASRHSLSISRRHVETDIATFVDETLQEKIARGVLRVGNPALVDEVKRALVMGADGMFLWVAFQIQEVCEQLCDDDIRTVISTLPRGLRATYDRILQRVCQRGMASVALKVFRWTGAVRQPLTLEELREALTVEPGQDCFRRERLINGFENMVSWCGNLVTVDEESGAVQFAHSTVKRYIFSDAALGRFRCVLADADTQVGEACVTYLCFSDFERQLVKTPKLDLAINPASIAATALSSSSSSRAFAKPFQALAKMRKDPRAAKIDKLAQLLPSHSIDPASAAKEFFFLAYASRHWIAHTSNFTEDMQAWGHFRHLVTNDVHFASLSFQIRSSHYEKPLPRYILEFNHRALLDVLLRWRRHIQDDDISEVFSGSCDRGMTEITTSALISGRVAETVIMDRIEYAAAAGDCDFLDLLASVDKAVEARDRYLALALFVAAGSGRVYVVRKLLAAGADLNAEVYGAFGGTALAATISAPDVEMLILLVDAGAKFRPTEAPSLAVIAADPRTVVLQDRESGKVGNLKLRPEKDVPIIKSLLRAGVDVNRVPVRCLGPTVLQAACTLSLLELAKLLLRAGADVNAEPYGNGGRTALQAAAEKANRELVQLLLRSRANVNAAPYDVLGKTALQAAAGAEALEIVEAMLDAGADVNAEPAARFGKTALQAAAAAGDVGITQRLLDAGANVNAEPSSIGGVTALQAASEANSVELVRLLLGADANVNACHPAGRGRSVLRPAILAGNCDIVTLLLGAGADANAEQAGESRSTLLQAAAAAGDVRIVSLLLEAGAELDAAPAREGGLTALQAAAAFGHVGVVKRLLAAGADPNGETAEEDGTTAYDAACNAGHMVIADLLRLAGAHGRPSQTQEDSHDD